MTDATNPVETIRTERAGRRARTPFSGGAAACRPGCMPGSTSARIGRRPRRHRRESPAGGRGGAAGRDARHPASGPQRARRGGRAWPRRRPPACRRARHRSARIAARHPDRRLRAGAARRRAGRRGRRGACRVEGRDRRRRSPRPSTAMETLGADRDRIAAAIGPCIGAPATRSTTLSSRRFCEAEDPENERFFLAGAAPGTTSSTSRPMSSRASRWPACAASRRLASTPMPIRTASSATAAPPIAASPAMAARSR